MRIQAVGMRLHGWLLAVSASLIIPGTPQSHAAPANADSPRFEVLFPAAIHAPPITGRLFLMISRTYTPEVRLQSTWVNSPEIVGFDVTQLNADQAVVVDGSTLGAPIRSIGELPDGDYYVQAVLTLYTQFHRADGHVIWAHLDRGEGQQFNTSPGNLYSPVRKVHLDRTADIRLSLTKVIPPLQPAADTVWVKRVRIQSKLLSEFWGQPIYLGAVVLLPRDYDSRPGVRYPAIYVQPEHFRSSAPFEFSEAPPSDSAGDDQKYASLGYESGYEFYRSWRSNRFPRMIAVSIQTQTPLSDWSGAVDSVNNGPYGRAIISELIPYLEKNFRIIREPFARVLTGKASGARAALALQLMHADLFGGAWIFRPWPFDFQHYFGVNIYQDQNVYTLNPGDLPEFGRNPSAWSSVERGYARTTKGTPFVTLRQAGQHDSVMAGMAGGDPVGADDAIVGPVGDNGLPKPMWDRASGKIDPVVAAYWGAHGDLLYFAQSHWAGIGPKLVDKLHFYVDNLDEFYRNYGVRDFEGFLKGSANPHVSGEFSYSYGIDHQGGWVPMTNAELVRVMARHIADHAPQNAPTEWQHDLPSEK